MLISEMNTTHVASDVVSQLSVSLMTCEYSARKTRMCFLFCQRNVLLRISKTIACSFQSFMTFGGRRQDCFHAGYDLLMCWHIQGICLCSQTVQKSALRNGARRTCRNSGTNGGKGTASCGCNIGALIPTPPPSSSSTYGVNSLPSASSSKLPVYYSPGGNRLIVRAFTTPHGVPTRTVFDPSVGPKYVPCSNRQSKGPRRRLDGCRDMHHTHSLNCAKGGTARLPTFLSYAVLPSRPTTNRPCMLAAHDTGRVNRSLVCWHLHTRS